MNIYVSNIPYTATDETLRDAFAAFGTVQSARIIKDRMTGRSRGFGFVEMQEDEEARKALEGLNGSEMLGRRINAREARPREEGNGQRPVGNGNANGDRQGGYRQREPRPQVINRGVY
jgi:RNA recognition motif-containing protein